jgi:hypothetical protein
MSFHEYSPRGDVHGIHYWTYPTAAARDAHAPSEGPPRAINATDVVHKRICLVLEDYSFWVLTNHSPRTWSLIGGGGGGETEYQADLLDNASDYVVVADASARKAVEVFYSFQLPVSGRQMVGKIRIQHDGVAADLIHDYDFQDAEITGVTFGAALVGMELRLTIVCAAVGENPKLRYKLSALSLAA